MIITNRDASRPYTIIVIEVSMPVTAHIGFDEEVIIIGIEDAIGQDPESDGHK